MHQIWITVYQSDITHVIKLPGTLWQTDQKLFYQLQLYKLPIACLQSSTDVMVNNHTYMLLGRVASHSHQFCLLLSQHRCEDHHILGAVERHTTVVKCTVLTHLITSWVPFVHRKSYVAYKTIRTPHLTGNKTLYKYCHDSVLILYIYTIQTFLNLLIYGLFDNTVRNWDSTASNNSKSKNAELKRTYKKVAMA
jgi:hypothetical protein